MAEGATMGQNEKNEKESISNISQSAERIIKIKSLFFLLDLYVNIITSKCGENLSYL